MRIKNERKIFDFREAALTKKFSVPLSSHLVQSIDDHSANKKCKNFDIFAGIVCAIIRRPTE